MAFLLLKKSDRVHSYVERFRRIRSQVRRHGAEGRRWREGRKTNKLAHAPVPSLGQWDPRVPTGRSAAVTDRNTTSHLNPVCAAAGLTEVDFGCCAVTVGSMGAGALFTKIIKLQIKREQLKTDRQIKAGNSWSFLKEQHTLTSPAVPSGDAVPLWPMLLGAQRTSEDEKSF